MIKIDKYKLKEVLDKRDWSQNLLAEKVGLSKSTFSQKINEDKLTETEYRLMCMILGKPEDYFIRREEEVKPAANPVQSAIDVSRMLDKIETLEQEVKMLTNSLGDMAKLVIDMHKAVMETKAQSQLNYEEISVAVNKATDINSTVNKISGHLKAKWSAVKKEY